LGAVFGFFQEASISHAAVIGVGRDAMTEKGEGWILSRLSVFIEERPKYGELVTVRSWPRGPEKLFCLRDYDILNADGKALVRGRSGWLVVDMEKRRPKRIEPIAAKLPLNEGVDALKTGPLSLATRENLVSAGERTAAYSDIDYYGHVNNVRYVQWIQDICDPDSLDNAKQMRLDINYMSEILPGEKVGLFSAAVEHGPVSPDYPAVASSAFAYEGRRPEGQAVFRAELRLG
jgi:acyl-ACP thioesterase